MNYSLSWWIANLGVVPLFRSAALRFCPILTFFRDLLFFVTLVLETMKLLPIISVVRRICSNKHHFLPLALIYVNFNPSLLAAKYENQVTIGLGEYRKINVTQLDKYSVSNNSIVSHKYFKNKGEIVLKAKSIGYGEMVIWNRTGRNRKIKIFVIKKSQRLALAKLEQELSQIGLETRVTGKVLSVSGKIEKLKNYYVLKKLIKNQKLEIYQNLSINPKVKKKILGEVYHNFFNYNLNLVKCQFQGIDLDCFLQDSKKVDKNTITFLEESYFLKIHQTKSTAFNKNYIIKMKIILSEHQSGREINFGLSQLNGRLDDLFTIGLSGVLRRNQILLRSQGMKLNTLAEPEIITKINQMTSIEVGAELPYQAISGHNEAASTQWKFSGLKVDLSMDRDGPFFILNYQTQITRPNEDGSISGNKQKSQIQLELGQTYQLFQIAFNSDYHGNMKMPALSKVPVLGLLFTSQSKRSIYKKITGVIKIEESYSNNTIK